MAADEVVKVVGEDLVVGLDEAGDVLDLAEAIESQPGRIHDID